MDAHLVTRLSVLYWDSNTSSFFLSDSTFASKVLSRGALRDPFIHNEVTSILFAKQPIIIL